MSRQSSHITITDQFCGAGGSSQGAMLYGLEAGLGTGLEIRLAMNHWERAIQTHAANFPDTDHVSTDISACNPRDYRSTTGLITSPECVNHSNAKGKKQVKAQMDAFATGKQDASAERSRATMWDVVRFAEFHRYKFIITENVVEATEWVLIDAWFKAMHALGYMHQTVYLNAMFCWPTPQRRDRAFFVFWRKGQRKPDLNIKPLAPCMKCGYVEAIQYFKPGGSVKKKYGTQYVYVCPTCAATVTPFYYAAINAIDWTIPAVRIGDRKRPLEDRTMRRIEHGMKKYAGKPIMLTNYFSSGLACRVKEAATEPMFTQHSRNGTAMTYPGFTIETSFGENDKSRSRGMEEASQPQTTNRSQGVVAPFMTDINYSHAGVRKAKSMVDPLSTQTAQQSLGLAIPPAMITSLNYPEQESRQLDVPLDTFTSNRPMGLTIPPALMVCAGSLDFKSQPMDAPLPTQTASDRMGVVSPFVVKMRGTSDGHVKASATGVDDPIGTISADGLHHALITGKAYGFLQGYYKSVSNVGLDDPMGTVRTTSAHALITGTNMRIEDMYFRMIDVPEVQAGMAFASDYKLLGNKREKVRMLGNAVPPPMMKILTGRCIESLR